MSDLQTLFENETQGDDQDAANAGAGQILHKLAGDAGVHLETLGHEKMAELGTALTGTPVQTQEDTMNTNELTTADVSVELAKIASREGVDLETVSREDYHEAFDKLAADMQQPEYWERQNQIKEAHDLGAHIADSFLSTIKEAGLGDIIKGGVAATRNGANRALNATKRQKTKAFEALGAAAKGGSSGKTIAARAGDVGTGRRAAKALAATAGGAALLGTAGGYAAGKSKSASAEEIEEAAYKLASEHMIAHGYDPETGEKIASDVEAAVEARAVEMLQSTGLF